MPFLLPNPRSETRQPFVSRGQFPTPSSLPAPTLMPSPGIQRRELTHNPRFLMGDGFVHIGDVVITIRYAIVVEIPGVNQVRICCGL